MFATLVFLIAAFLFLLLAVLRYSKGIAPLRQYESVLLPGFPGPRGLIVRLDGMERRHREIVAGRSPLLCKDGGIQLPEHWEGKMTAGRMACVAHTWGLCQLAEEDPLGAKSRESAVFRAIIITFFVFLIALALVFVKHVPPKVGGVMVAGTWAFLAFTAIPTQYRERKAANLAKSRLKETGLWPRHPQDGEALDQCLSAMAWCRVAGFRRILPK